MAQCVSIIVVYASFFMLLAHSLNIVHDKHTEYHLGIVPGFPRMTCPSRWRNHLSREQIIRHSNRRYTTILSDFSWLFGVAAYNFDLVGVDCSAIIKFEVDVFENKCPDLIAETISLEVALFERFQPPLSYRLYSASITLKVNLALTFSASVSAAARSNVARIFIAS